MKNLIKGIFGALFLLCFSVSFAQEKYEVTGVWVGEIFNDSTQQYIPFELAVSQRNGVYSGYSYTIFTVDSIENIGVKEVTITEKNGRLIVKDKKLIDDNYTDRPAKGVYTTFELNHTQNDTADFLNGRWFTNKTKQYYPLSGTASLSKKKRIYETRIIQRLSYLGLANRLSFVNPHGSDVAMQSSDKKPDEEPMMTIVEPEMIIELPKSNREPDIVLPKAGELAGILESIVDTAASEKKSREAANTNIGTVIHKTTASDRPESDAQAKADNQVIAKASSDKRLEQPLKKPDVAVGSRNVSVVGESPVNKEVSESLLPSKEIKKQEGVYSTTSEVQSVGTGNPTQEIAKGETAQRTVNEVAMSSGDLKKALVESEKEREEAVQKSVAEPPISSSVSKNALADVEKAKNEAAQRTANEVVVSSGHLKKVMVEPEKKEEAAQKSADEVVLSSNDSKKAIAEVEKAKNEAAIVKNLANRKIETIQSVKIVSDSIVLSLFDNGIVDGDTVSVLLNDKVIISKVGLLTTAYNHTLHLTPDMGDSLKLILYAENLGSIPPNTGLLVVRDGKKNHEIRFSGDLRNNSAVILVRNREE